MRDAIDKLLGRVMALAVAVVILMAGYVLIRLNAGALTRAPDIQVEQAEAVVRNARILIEKKRRDPTAFGDFSEATEIPASLRISKPRYAKVHADQLDLVIARNSDVSMGARIWALQHRPHHDEPARYANIWFFRYSNE